MDLFCFLFKLVSPSLIENSMNSTLNGSLSKIRKGNKVDLGRTLVKNSYADLVQVDIVQSWKWAEVSSGPLD
jgi:hypothetical protein